jgi:hypothetical protein
MLRDLARYGFPSCGRTRTSDCVSLSSSTPDSRWANAFSVGEADLHFTPKGLAEFIRIIGRDGVAGNGRVALSRSTAQRLQSAMRATVDLGTARSIRGRLAGLGAIGGKTGSTAIGGANPFDGVFAGLIFDRSGTPRYIIVTYVRRGGVGGGNAAQISAELAALLLGSGAKPPR